MQKQTTIVHNEELADVFYKIFAKGHLLETSLTGDNFKDFVLERNPLSDEHIIQSYAHVIMLLKHVIQARDLSFEINMEAFNEKFNEVYFSIFHLKFDSATFNQMETDKIVILSHMHDFILQFAICSIEIEESTMQRIEECLQHVNEDDADALMYDFMTNQTMSCAVKFMEENEKLFPEYCITHNVIAPTSAVLN